MEKITIFFLSIFILLCLTGCNSVKIDTSSDEGFSKSLQSMYNEISISEKAQLILYLPVVLCKNGMLEYYYKAMSKGKLPSEEELLYNAQDKIDEYKIYLGPQSKIIGESVRNNLKEINGLTANEIVAKGKAILELYRKE